jgi:hypothetical protein
MLKIFISFGLVASTFLLALSNAPADSAGQTTIGVMQYNVKGGQGGWTDIDQIRAKQIQLIVNEIKELKAKASPIDFITLEQAHPPALAEDLREAGLLGWTTIGSQCPQRDPNKSPDDLQLSYSADWALVAKAGQNPLVEGYTANACWEWGRPYNIAYFHNKKTDVNVLFVIVHMPHCWYGLVGCFDEWHVPDFMNDVRKAVGDGLVDLKLLNFIASGDMNELGQDGGPTDFEFVFKQFGAVTKSPNVKTCCQDNGFSASYDHLVTNRGTILETSIIDNGAYPIDPDFDARHPNGEVHNEEHKAIYGVVTLPIQ